MSFYKVLNKQEFQKGHYKIIPIRYEDRFKIMKWRNEQMYHLRQNAPLTIQMQDEYFNQVVLNLFDKEKPAQILFSYMYKEQCIGYGGLVHINWIDKHAEISFLMNTELEAIEFDIHWATFLQLIQEVAFESLKLHKIFTYAFDIRPHLYKVIENQGFAQEAVLKQHCFFDGKFIDVIIHSKFAQDFPTLRFASIEDIDVTFRWVNNPEVRSFSYSRELVTFEAHKKWFSSKIEDENCVYYILELQNEKIGSIRFDIDNDENAKISYLIDPTFFGQGFGKKILEKGVEKIKHSGKDIFKVYGYVQSENIASIRIFESLNFKKEYLNDNELYFWKDLHS